MSGKIIVSGKVIIPSANRCTACDVQWAGVDKTCWLCDTSEYHEHVLIGQADTRFNRRSG